VYCQTRLKEPTRFPVDKMVDKSGDTPDTADSMRESKFCVTQKTSCQITNTSEGEAKAIPSTWVRRTQLVESRPHGETGAAFVRLEANDSAERHPLLWLS